mgnify:CR=1 FL=1
MMNKYDKEFWDMLDKMVEKYEIKIDRPKGSAHPKYKDYIYPLDYGFLDGTKSPDGGGIDIWVGTSDAKIVSGIISSVDFLKGDSEIKILYACTEEEVKKIYEKHNSTDGMKGILSYRI